MESFDYRPRTDGVKVEPVRSQRREEVKAIPPFKLSNNVNDKSLEDEVSRHLQQRADRRGRSQSLNVSQAAVDAAFASNRIAAPLPSSIPRDTPQPLSPTLTDPGSRLASARENIMALAASGTKARIVAPELNPNAPRTLASLMGGAVRPPRLMRVGTGPTEDEKEGTERLEKEMETKRAQWSGKTNGGPTTNGTAPVSLASLMQGKVTPSTSTDISNSSTSTPQTTSPLTPTPTPLRSAPPTRGHSYSQSMSQSSSSLPPILTATQPSSTTNRNTMPPSPPVIRTHTRSSSYAPPPPYIPTNQYAPSSAAPPPTVNRGHTRSASLMPSPSALQSPPPLNNALRPPPTPPLPLTSPSAEVPLPPRSIGAMFGTSATGPRLNRPPPTASSSESGSAHSRTMSMNGFAMPGMVRLGGVGPERTALSENSSRSSLSALPSVQEATTVTRAPPSMQQQQQQQQERFVPPPRSPSVPPIAESATLEGRFDYAPAQATAPTASTTAGASRPTISRSASPSNVPSPPSSSFSSPDVRSSRPPASPSSTASQSFTTETSSIATSQTSTSTQLPSSTVSVDKPQFSPQPQRFPPAPSLSASGAAPARSSGSSAPIPPPTGLSRPPTLPQANQSTRPIFRPHPGSPTTRPYGHAYSASASVNTFSSTSLVRSPLKVADLVRSVEQKYPPPPPLSAGFHPILPRSESPSSGRGMLQRWAREVPEFVRRGEGGEEIRRGSMPTSPTTVLSEHSNERRGSASPAYNLSSQRKDNGEKWDGSNSSRQSDANERSLTPVATAPPRPSFESRPSLPRLSSKPNSPTVSSFNIPPLNRSLARSPSPVIHRASPSSLARPTPPPLISIASPPRRIFPPQSIVIPPPAAIDTSSFRLNPSPRFDSPPMEAETWGEMIMLPSVSNSSVLLSSGDGLGVSVPRGSVEGLVPDRSSAEYLQMLEDYDRKRELRIMMMQRSRSNSTSLPTPSIQQPSLDSTSLPSVPASQPTSPPAQNPLPRRPSQDMFGPPPPNRGTAATFASDYAPRVTPGRHARSQSHVPSSIDAPPASLGPAFSTSPLPPPQINTAPLPSPPLINRSPSRSRISSPIRPAPIPPPTTRTFSNGSSSSSRQYGSISEVLGTIAPPSRSSTSTPVPLSPRKPPQFSPRPSLSKTTSISDLLSLLRPAPVSNSLVLGAPISTEFITLTATSASSFDCQGIFYETETIAIAHRSIVAGEKPMMSLFVWRGKGAVEKDEAEMRKKVMELRDHFKTDVIEVRQGRESAALLRVLGGQLVTRRGSRAQFERYDSRCYVVRSESEGLFIDELAMSSLSICSAHCNVICLMGEVFVWVGAGALNAERRAVSKYAIEIADGRSITKFDEGQESDRFWDILESTEYASANHWRYRRLARPNVSLLTISAESTPTIIRDDSLTLSASTISLLDAGFEYIVVVPSAALLSSSKSSVSLAIRSAEALALNWKDRQLPFQPPVHILCFPTLIPKDLRFISRKLDWDSLNRDVIPAGRLNIHTTEEALLILE